MKTRSLALCLVVLLAAGAAHATPTEDAMRHHQRALELYSEQNYDAALIEFERAYKIMKTYKLLYNIGQVAKQINDYARAMQAFDQYLNEGGNEIPAARRTELREEIARLSTRVARIDVKSNAAAGELSIDDSPVGNFPLTAPLLVNVGRRRVTLHDATLGTRTKVVDVMAGETSVVDLAFETTPKKTAEPPPPVEHVEPPSFPVLPWVITGIIGAGAAVTGIVALDKRSKAKDLERTQPLAYDANPSNDHLNSQLDSASKTAQTWGITTDVLLGATVVSGVVSGYLTYRYFHQKGRSAPAVGLGISPTSVSLQGAF